MTSHPKKSQIKNRHSLIAIPLLLLAACRGDRPRHFGPPFTDAPDVPIARLLEAPSAFARRPVRVTGTIQRQCPSAGCWLILQDPHGNTLRAELGDSLPRLPIRTGHRAQVEGELIPHGQTHILIGTRVTFTPQGTRP